MAAASTGDNGLQKEETVYVNTTAGGEVTDVTVSDWLKNSGDSSNSEVKDASDLQDIKNVKGDETFTQNGNDLTWSTDGKDIYYQGKTEKNLPVSVGIKYYMDGTEVSPEALAGKTGHLKMEAECGYLPEDAGSVHRKSFPRECVCWCQILPRFPWHEPLRLYGLHRSFLSSRQEARTMYHLIPPVQ